jgi:hypothetical protein
MCFGDALLPSSRPGLCIILPASGVRHGRALMFDRREYRSVIEWLQVRTGDRDACARSLHLLVELVPDIYFPHAIHMLSADVTDEQ